MVEPAAPKVFACFVHDDAVEQEQRDEIGNGHQRIHAIGKVPDNLQIGHTSHEDCHDVEHPID